MTSDISHGWVKPRQDGARARCGGPTACSTCQTEQMHGLMLQAIFDGTHFEQRFQRAQNSQRLSEGSATSLPFPQGKDMQLHPPTLVAGETYVGAIADQQGNLQHIILLPGDAGPADHASQVSWAQGIGGALPNKAEQALLWSSCPDQFQHEWYWSGQEYERNSAFAWCQIFGNGTQNTRHKQTGTARARAVRRVAA